MKITTVHYDLLNNVSVEITRLPRTRDKKIEFIVGGEGHMITKFELQKFFANVEELKRDI